MLCCITYKLKTSYKCQKDMSYGPQQILVCIINQQYLMMKPEQKVKYVEKTYQIFVRSICLKDELKMNFYSNFSAKQHNFQGQIILNINKAFTLTTIDTLCQSESKINKDITMNLYIRQLIFSGLVFDINIQKLVKQSKTIFRKQLKNKKGFVDYKFISCKTRFVSYQSFKEENRKREKIYWQQFNDYQKIKQDNQKKNELIKQKDVAISHLNLQILQGNKQIANLNKKLDDQFLKLKQGLNIKVKVNSNNPIHQPKEDFQKIAKEKSQQVKNLELQLKKMELQMALIQDLGGFGTKDEDQQDENILNKSHLTKKLQQSNFFSSSDSDGSQQLPNYQNNFSIRQSRSKIEQSFVKNHQPSSNFLQIPIFASSPRESNLIEKNKRSIVKLSNSIVRQSKFRPNEPQNIKSSSIRIQPKEHELSSNKKSNIFQNASQQANKQNEQLKLKIESLKGQFEIERQQKLFLKQQSIKKSKQIQKFLKKIAQGEKQKLQFQQQKGRLLQMFANKLCLGDKEQNVKIIIKEMTTFNKNNQKQNTILIKQNAKLNKKLNSQMKKYQNLELGYSQSVLKITHLNKQIQHYQEKCNKKLVDASVSADFLSLKQQQECQALKNKINENQREISIILQSQKQLKEHQVSLNQQISILQQQKAKSQIIADQNQILKLQLNRMAIKSLRAQKIEQNYTILIQNYETLLSSHDQLKLKLIKLEHHYNKNVKHDDLVLYQQQMDKILIVMFKQVSKFEKEFYGVLLLTNKVALQSQIKYYESFIKNEELFTKQWSEAQRYILIRQKQQNIKRIKAKSVQFEQKINTTMQTLQQQIASFEEGVTIVQKKLIQLQKSRQEMYSFLRSLNIDVSQFISIKESTLKSSASKGRLSIQQCQILQQQNEDDDDNKNQNKLYNSTLKVSQPKNEIKKSSFLQTSNKFQLTKLKHSIAVKKSLLNEGTNIVASKVFSILKQSSQMNASCHELIAAKKQMSLQRMKIRDRQLKNFQQSSQMVKKIDNSLFDQKIEKDRLILQYQKREKALQNQYQKMVKNYQAKIDQYKVKIREKEEQIQNLQEKRQKIKQEMNQLHTRILAIKAQSLQGTQYILVLQDQRDILRQKLQKLEKHVQMFQMAENQLMKQVQRIKDYSNLNQAMLKQLIQQRNEQFQRLQQSQQKKIKKMTKIIQQLQARIMEQGQQYMFNKSNLEYDIERKDQHIQFLTNKIQELQATISNISQINQRLSAYNSQLQHYNEEYQQNLRELAQQIEQKERQILQLEAMVSKLKQEINYDIDIGQEIKKIQKKHKQEYNQSLIVSRQQIKRWQQQFAKLQFTQQKLINESRQRELQKVSLQNDKKALNEVIKKRQGQILKLQRLISQKQLHINNLSLQITKIQLSYQQIKKDKQQADRLASIQRQQISSLTDQQSKRKRKKNLNQVDASKSINNITPQQRTPTRKYGDLLLAQSPYRINSPQIQQFIINDNYSQSSFDSVQNRLQQISKQNQQLLKEKLSLQALIHQKQELISNLITQMHNKDDQICKLHNKNAKLQEKVKEKHQNIEKLMKELILNEKQINQQQRQIQRITKSLRIKQLCNLNEGIVHKQLIDLKYENTNLKSLISSFETTATDRSSNLKNTLKYLELQAKNNIFSKSQLQKQKKFNNKQNNLIAIRDIDSYI